MNATHSTSGRSHVVDVVACNRGPSTYYVYTSQSGAWTDTMRGPDGEVQTRNELYTDICTHKAFRPGEALRGRLTWDETIYQGQDGEGKDHPAKPAPPGQYAWTVTFTAWHEDTCPYAEDLRSIDVEFHLVV